MAGYGDIYGPPDEAPECPEPCDCCEECPECECHLPNDGSSFTDEECEF